MVGGVSARQRIGGWSRRPRLLSGRGVIGMADVIPIRPPVNVDFLLAVVPAARDAACCAQHVDADGRWPIGYCSPECERRPGGTLRPWGSP